MSTPAFPQMDFYDEKLIGSTPGMTLRDYFAGQALAGLVLAVSVATSDLTQLGPEQVSALAYRYADAMLKEETK